MRLIGMAERAIELMAQRALSRSAFGGCVSDKTLHSDRAFHGMICTSLL
jgi:alkylation response protein AidB-like acyl-CoA dehydrogenase